MRKVKNASTAMRAPNMPAIDLQQSAPTICDFLRHQLPNLMGVYVFGSQAQGTAGPDSDLDLAVLVAGYVEPVTLWELGSQLADLLDIDLDLLDLRAASTVMQHQVITGGQRLWFSGSETEEFELFVLSAKFDLDLWRKPIIDQIQAKGNIYGR